MMIAKSAIQKTIMREEQRLLDGRIESGSLVVDDDLTTSGDPPLLICLPTNDQEALTRDMQSKHKVTSVRLTIAGTYDAPSGNAALSEVQFFAIK